MPLFHNLRNTADKVADVLILDHEWRGSLEHPKAASAYLGQDTPFPAKLRGQSLPRAEGEFAGRSLTE
jgi:hypothetical protein